MRYLANCDILRHLLLVRDVYLTTIFKQLPLSLSDTVYWNACLKAIFYVNQYYPGFIICVALAIAPDITHTSTTLTKCQNMYLWANLRQRKWRILHEGSWCFGNCFHTKRVIGKEKIFRMIKWQLCILTWYHMPIGALPLKCYALVRVYQIYIRGISFCPSVNCGLLELANNSHVWHRVDRQLRIICH